MHMSFWFSADLGDFLFSGFKVTTTTALVATCIGLLSLTILSEAMKFLRARAKQQFAAAQIQTHNRLILRGSGGERSALLSGFYLKDRIYSVMSIVGEVFLYFTQESINWIIMLAVMGYNGYIFLSVLAGAGLGYAFFGQSLEDAKVESLKLKVASMTCGDCQVKEGENETAGQSDPPALLAGSASPSVVVVPSTPVVTVHHCDASG